MQSTFSVGVEEEFFLLDKNKLDLLNNDNKAIFEACEADPKLGIQHELFTSQLEAVTEVCHSFSELFDSLAYARKTLQNILAEFDADIIAASTFPTGKCSEQHITDNERYPQMYRRFAGAAKRFLCNGLHVHFECHGDRERLFLLNRFPCFMSILLALSASSPYFEGKDTRLQSYRSILFEGLPLSGVGHDVGTEDQYKEMLDLFTKVGFINDARDVHWFLRLNSKFPTLELRVCDAMPNLEHLVAVAALYVCLAITILEKDPGQLPFYTEHYLYLRYYFWQARRYPFDEIAFIDFHNKKSMAFEQVIADMLEFVMPVAHRLGCVDRLDKINDILKEGTSSDRQRAAYRQSKDYKAVVSQLVSDTHAYDGAK